MATPDNFYSRITPVPVLAGAGETLVLSPGVLGTDFAGTLLYAAGSAAVGDVTRLIAWGIVQGGGMGGGTLRIRSYFNPGGVVTGALIADTGAAIPLPQITNPVTEWMFILQFTVQSLGVNGNAAVLRRVFAIPLIHGICPPNLHQTQARTECLPKRS